MMLYCLPLWQYLPLLRRIFQPVRQMYLIGC
nr:MAG TPA: hypothetical protein [Caudoviricetes sp.]